MRGVKTRHHQREPVKVIKGEERVTREWDSRRQRAPQRKKRAAGFADRGGRVVTAGWRGGGSKLEVPRTKPGGTSVCLGSSSGSRR